MPIISDVIAAGLAADRPAASPDNDGYLYYSTDTSALERSNGTSWDSISTGGGSSGGVPILRGPYTVDVSTLNTVGQTQDLWTPAAGDILLRIFPNFSTLVPWDNSGFLAIGQNMTAGDGAGTIARMEDTISTSVWEGNFDNLQTAAGGNAYDASSNVDMASARILTADPVQVMYWANGPSTSTGHADLYALVATPAAP